MPSDEWDVFSEKTKTLVLARPRMNQADWGRLLANTMRAIDTAAERRGIERAAKIADEYADWTYWGQYANASAAEAAAAEIAKAIRLGRWLTPDEISTLDHIGKAPLEGKAAKEYQCGYADALRALAQPMADAGPMEPAGASDREGT